jgi:hypothetical protein
MCLAYLHFPSTAAVASLSQSCLGVGLLRDSAVIRRTWLVDPLCLAVKLLGLRSVLSFMLLSLRCVLVVKRVWVASGDGLIELILILVRRFVGRRGEVRLRGRLIGHLKDQDEQLAKSW